MDFPRASKSPGVAIAMTGVTGLLLLTSCSQWLTVEAGPTGSVLFCTNLSQALPVEVADELIRATSSSDQGVTAWGDPAIVLRCGVKLPESYTPTSQLLTTNGIEWLPEKLSQGQRFTTINTTELIEVNIPANYESVSGILIDLAKAFPTN